MGLRGIGSAYIGHVEGSIYLHVVAYSKEKERYHLVAHGVQVLRGEGSRVRVNLLDMVKGEWYFASERATRHDFGSFYLVVPYWAGNLLCAIIVGFMLLARRLLQHKAR
jgi:hypothetical protein